MGLAVSTARVPGMDPDSGHLTPQQLIEIYRLMFLSRRVDDREILLKRQQKIYFQVSGAGHEALAGRCCVGPPSRLRLVFPLLSRSRALPRVGRYPRRYVFAGRRRGHRSGQRRPPDARALEQPSSAHRQHFVLDHHAVLHAVGCAEAGRYFSRHPEAAAKTEGDYRAFRDVEFHDDEVALTCLGEGSTSQGEFWEALNTASNQKLPVIFCVEDNGYAISVPVEVNTPGGNISI
jgi:2-oxoisovalerate dehydrogenase E1 component